MRIISGTAKGRRLKTPKNSKTIRPALAQVREAIFSSLGDLSGKTVLDVFAGTGSLGMEALSREAAFVGFVDGGPEAVHLLIENLKTLGFEDRARVFKRKLPSGLDAIKMPHTVAVAFCDPPYDMGLLSPTLERLAAQPYCDADTLFIAEHTRREMPEVATLDIVKEKKFGQTLLTYLRKKP